MSTDRNAEVLSQVLADLHEMNIGPNANVPVKTIWTRAIDRGGVQGAELTAALQLGVDTELLTFTPGGIANMGTITLTDDGFSVSRSQ
jgi:hypothetical protein